MSEISSVLSGKTELILLSVPLERITIPDYASVFSFPENSDVLDASIDRFGITNPPLLNEKFGEYIVVSGVRRIAAAKRKGYSEVTAAIISEGSYSEKELFDMNFDDNVSVRNYNIVEIAGTVTILTDYFKLNPEEIAKKYLSDTDFKSGNQSINELKAIYKLHIDIKRFLVKWKVSFSAASRFLVFRPAELKKVFQTVEQLQLHGGKLKQFLEFIFEISRRDKQASDEILNDGVVQDILDNEKITLSQKQAKLISHLYIKRFPQLSSHEKEFLHLASQLKKIPSGAFAPPQNFEGDKIYAKFAFKNIEEIDAIFEALKDEHNRKRIKQLFDLLYD